MNPTRAFMDGVLKYKSLYGELDDPERHFLYDNQERYLEFVFDGRSFPSDLPAGPARDGFRSLECQIMDWADDTAYSLNDLVDSANAGFLSNAALGRWQQDQDLDDGEVKLLDGLVAALEVGELARVMNRRIGAFVEAVRLVERENFMADRTNRYRFGIELDTAVVREQKLYAQLAREVVFRSPQVCQLEHKGGFMIERIFAALKDNYLEGGRPPLMLLSGTFEREMDAAGDDRGRRARVICDYLAGMTDGFASRIYKRLFDPDYGSIVDLV
jgi:dGTPase